MNTNSGKTQWEVFRPDRSSREVRGPGRKPSGRKPGRIRPAAAAASAPECSAAADQLRDLVGNVLASAPAVTLCEDAPAGCLRVQMAGVEVDIVLQPTGVTQKICANPTCQNAFWGGGSGATATKFCSRRCGNQVTTREWNARHANGPVKAIPRIISRTLASNGLLHAEGNGPGFSAKAVDVGTEVRGDPETLARCAEVLVGLGYGVEVRMSSLLVTERRAAA